jgi:hypothetical protein
MQGTGHHRVRGGYLDDYRTHADVIARLPRFVNGIYNTRRLHAVLCAGEMSRAPFREPIFVQSSRMLQAKTGLTEGE